MKISYLKAVVMAGMLQEDLAKYKNELKEHSSNEAFKDLSIEELKEYHKNLDLAGEVMLEKALEGKASSSEVSELKAELSAIKDGQLVDLRKALEKQGKEAPVQVGHAATKSFISQVEEALSAPENVLKLKALKSGEKVEFEFEVKAAGTITGSNIIGADSNLLPAPAQFGLVNIAKKVPFITEIVDNASTDSASITWTDEVNADGDAAFTAEGTLKPLIDMDFEPKLSAAKKIAGVIKVSEEMLEDIPFMAAEINSKLRTRHDIVKEEGILFGDNSLNSAQFDGIAKDAAAFIAGSLAGTVDEANNYDAIRAAITQITVAGNGEFFPDYVLVNPEDAASMDLTKTVEGLYVLPTFVTEGGAVIKGVRVLEKVQIPAGEFLVGDFKKSHVREYVPFRIKIGYENDDFRKNLRTIIGESRCHHFISSNEYNAFVYDTFANAKSALETA